MTNKETIDLDSFLDEVLGKGKSFTLYGKTWKLRAEVPAAVMLTLRSEAETTDEQEFELFRQLLDPPEQMDELLKMGLGAMAFSVVVRIALGVYSGQTPDEVLVAIKAEREAELEGPKEPVDESPETPSSNIG